VTTGRRFAVFNAVGLLGIGVQLGAIHALTSEGMAPVEATAVAVALAVVHNYLWHWLWTWRDRHSAVSSPAAGFFVGLAGFAASNGLVSLVTNVLTVAALTGRVPTMAANGAAIVLSGLVNFAVSDRVVFRVGQGEHGIARDAPFTDERAVD
jgi:putative flippase GtrA